MGNESVEKPSFHPPPQADVEEQVLSILSEMLGKTSRESSSEITGYINIKSKQKIRRGG